LVEKFAYDEKKAILITCSNYGTVEGVEPKWPELKDAPNQVDNYLDNFVLKFGFSRHNIHTLINPQEDDVDAIMDDLDGISQTTSRKIAVFYIFVGYGVRQKKDGTFHQTILLPQADPDTKFYKMYPLELKIAQIALRQSNTYHFVLFDKYNDEGPLHDSNSILASKSVESTLSALSVA